ncbi:MAG: hypothetical protein JRI23_29105 [Deltaproteobacteria bacterium]|jgi:hypothetical protein|nr:hypothetical protein [Deltaproteobacteria bacterium]MBW2536190.1 hypothetical protein [Deltaproteobacteria bacterium]
MERLRVELSVAGEPVHFLAINTSAAADYQHELVNRCAFPLFQDLETVDAPSMHHARKDDILVYDSQGLLAAYLTLYAGPAPLDGGTGEPSSNIVSPEGYANLRRIILETP